MKTTIAVAILALTLAGGCAHQMRWTSPSYTADGFARDNYECVRDSRTSWGGSGLVGIAVMSSIAQHQANQMYALCMKSKGWSLVEGQ